VEAQSDSALRIAQNLSSHTAVERVYYPGLTSHPGHDIAKAQMSNRFGSVMSIELKADLAKTKRFVESVQIFHLALSLGAVESLIELPATLSHASYDPKALLDDLHRALDLAGL
jgi:cystathionine gamma-lyase